jgi:hypothetical protein
MGKTKKVKTSVQESKRARMEKFLMSLGLPPLPEQIIGKKYELEMSGDRLEIQAGFVGGIKIEWACGEFHIYIQIHKFFTEDRGFIERTESDYYSGLWEIRACKYGKFRLIS